MQYVTEEMITKVIALVSEKAMEEIDQEEQEWIKHILLFHECEPSAAAERISEQYNVPYNEISKLL